MSKESDKKRQSNLDNLYNAGNTLTTHYCDRCDEEETFVGDDAEEAYDKGWRATERNVYCPSCAKKFKIK